MKPRKPTSPKAVVSKRVATPPDALFARIVTILEDACIRVVRAVNSEVVLAYRHVGREIVEEVQRGEDRASYGEAVLETLSAQLTERCGRGFSTTNVKYFRTFYQAYGDRQPEIRHEPRDESGALWTRLHAARGFSPALSWTHYRTPAQVEHRAERLVYELEAEAEAWSTSVLERQIHTHLFLRLLKSRDQAGVLDLVTRGQALQRPIDTVRDPYVLDFLGLPEAPQLRESDLESTIIAGLHQFLLELDEGFAFVARQKQGA